MKPVRIRTLESADAEALLTFELDNREWFERHIDARDAAFYSVRGVTEHITAYLSGYAAGNWHPFVIEDSGGKIVGRANLKDIDTSQRSAEVGYRIAQSACGQGLATQAVKHLVQEARLRWNLKQLVANVYAENIGSAKVLKRCGFLIEHPSGQEAMGWTPPHLGILSARLKVRTTVNSEKESTHEAYANWGRPGQERVSDPRCGLP